MKIIKGNKELNITCDDFESIRNRYEKTIVDLGTGDGRFVYEGALADPRYLYIGIDPSAKQLEIYSKKAVRRKLNNALFVLGSAEMLPIELCDSVDVLHILLPWGSLLQNVVKPTSEFLKNLKRLLKKDGDVEIILGYHPETDPSEVFRLNLPRIDENFIRAEMVSRFIEEGFLLKDISEFNKYELKKYPTTWSKRLSFGNNRPIFLLRFKLNSSL